VELSRVQYSAAQVTSAEWSASVEAGAAVFPGQVQPNEGRGPLGSATRANQP
jgi:hypothetical protein